jgi:hypothetical protein
LDAGDDLRARRSPGVAPLLLLVAVCPRGEFPLLGCGEALELVGCVGNAAGVVEPSSDKPESKTPRLRGFLIQGRQDSNLQPPVLETGALPVELLPWASGESILAALGRPLDESIS